MDLNDNPLVRWLEKVFSSDLVFPVIQVIALADESGNIGLHH